MVGKPHLTGAHHDRPEEPDRWKRTLGRRRRLPFLTPGRWPQGIGPGWKSLLDQLYYDLKSLDSACVITEAYPADHGALAIRVHTPAPVRDQARTLIASAVQRSRQTCERCGAPGRLYGGSWLRTLCHACGQSP
jgi:hypothetical protein